MDYIRWEDIALVRETNFHKLEDAKSTVIFMDCRNVTGNHARYNLFQKDPIYTIMAKCCSEVVEGLYLSCNVYAALDECSVIFPDTKELKSCFQMGDCGDYVLSLFIQRFLKLFWVYYPNIFVKSTIFQHSQEDVMRYLEYRKALCQQNALVWMAKEHLDKREYMAIIGNQKQMKDLLRKHGLYNITVANTAFYEGVLIHVDSRTSDLPFPGIF